MLRAIVRKCVNCLGILSNYHNPTDGPVLDILECMIGKTGLLKHGTTKPREELRNVLLKEMKKDYKKIVLVAHSQGTIITGNVVADLSDAANNAIDDISWFDKDSIWFEKDDNDETMKRKSAELKKTLKKFEVYLFAGCAQIMWMALMLIVLNVFQTVATSWQS